MDTRLVRISSRNLPLLLLIRNIDFKKKLPFFLHLPSSRIEGVSSDDTTISATMEF